LFLYNCSSIGIFLGKLIFAARFQAEKISLEEKLIALQAQFEQQKNTVF
jgi:DNA recombination protein RmuC